MQQNGSQGSIFEDVRQALRFKASRAYCYMVGLWLLDLDRGRADARAFKQSAGSGARGKTFSRTIQTECAEFSSTTAVCACACLDGTATLCLVTKLLRYLPLHDSLQRINHDQIVLFIRNEHVEEMGA